jgi:thiol-disulfide isomerase/thioredoxin
VYPILKNLTNNKTFLLLVVARMSLSVSYVRAEWCKVCKVLLPEVDAMCKKFGVPLTVLDLEDMSDDEQAAITSLPCVTVLENGMPKEVIKEKKKERLAEILSESMKIGDMDF